MHNRTSGKNWRSMKRKMKYQRKTTWKVRKRTQKPHFQEVCNLRFSSPRQVPQDLATRYSVKSQVPSAKCQVPQDLATRCLVSSQSPGKWSVCAFVSFCPLLSAYSCSFCLGLKTESSNYLALGGVLTQPLRLLARATTRKTPWLVCSVQDLDDYQNLFLLFFLICLGPYP